MPGNSEMSVLKIKTKRKTEPENQKFLSFDDFTWSKELSDR